MNSISRGTLSSDSGLGSCQVQAFPWLYTLTRISHWMWPPQEGPDHGQGSHQWGLHLKLPASDPLQLSGCLRSIATSKFCCLCVFILPICGVLILSYYSSFSGKRLDRGHVIPCTFVLGQGSEWPEEATAEALVKFLLFPSKGWLPSCGLVVL
jgi:hypothetical protein